MGGSDNTKRRPEDPQTPGRRKSPRLQHDSTVQSANENDNPAAASNGNSNGQPLRTSSKKNHAGKKPATVARNNNTPKTPLNASTAQKATSKNANSNKKGASSKKPSSSSKKHSNNSLKLTEDQREICKTALRRMRKAQENFADEERKKAIMQEEVTELAPHVRQVVLGLGKFIDNDEVAKKYATKAFKSLYPKPLRDMMGTDFQDQWIGLYTSSVKTEVNVHRCDGQNPVSDRH